MKEGENGRDESGRPVRIRTKKGRGVLIYRIKRRRNGRVTYDRDWTLRVVRNYRQHYFRLGSDARNAEKLANEIDAFLAVPTHSIEDALNRFAPDKAVCRPSEMATIGDLLDAHKKGEKALGIRLTTAAGYRYGLCRAVEIVKAHRQGKKRPSHTGHRGKAHWMPLRSVSLSILTRSFANDLKIAILSEADDDADEETKRAKRKSVNGYLASAQSMFSPEAMHLYSHLTLPDLSGFLSAPKLKNAEKRYQIPPTEIVERILKPDMMLSDPNVYVAYLLTLRAGMRRKEAGACRWAWFSDTKPRRINIEADGEFYAKRKEGYTQIEEWVYEELRRFGGKDYLIDGPETERKEKVFRRLAAWLRSKGLDSTRPIHELRSLFGSFVSTTKSLFVAQNWLRHTTVQMTHDKYADLVVEPRLIELWETQQNYSLRPVNGAASSGKLLTFQGS